MLLMGPSRVIADLLAYQARVGKVHKVGPATFAVVANSMSRSTRWRCLHWRNELEALRAAVASHPPLHTLAQFTSFGRGDSRQQRVRKR